MKDIIKLTFTEISYHKMSRKQVFAIFVIFVIFVIIVGPPSFFLIEELLFLLLLPA